MTSQINDFSGNYFLTPDHPVGYGSLISGPGAQLADMVASGIYFRENGDDVVLVNAGDTKVCSMYKTLSNQRLMNSFVFRCSTISGQIKVRLVHRSLALSMPLEAALKSVGQNITVSDDWSNLTQINQQLAPLFLQVWSA